MKQLANRGVIDSPSKYSVRQIPLLSMLVADVSPLQFWNRVLKAQRSEIRVSTSEWHNMKLCSDWLWHEPCSKKSKQCQLDATNFHATFQFISRADAQLTSDETYIKHRTSPFCASFSGYFQSFRFVSEHAAEQHTSHYDQWFWLTSVLITLCK